jgi:hypothetical protein
MNWIIFFCFFEKISTRSKRKTLTFRFRTFLTKAASSVTDVTNFSDPFMCIHLVKSKSTSKLVLVQHSDPTLVHVPHPFMCIHPIKSKSTSKLVLVQHSDPTLVHVTHPFRYSYPVSSKSTSKLVLVLVHVHYLLMCIHPVRSLMNSRALCCMYKFCATMIIMYELIRLTVSVNQSNKLDASIKCNRPFINSSIIITKPDDTSTLSVCFKNNVTCKTTNNLHINGAPFNKGKVYSDMQKLLHKDANIQGKHMLLLDADICIPKLLWNKILNYLPQTSDSLLSVIDRCILHRPNDLIANKYKIDSSPKGFVTTLGFFQLYRINKSSPIYPVKYRTAAISDKVFGNKFHRSKRIWLSGRVFHMGITHQWNGAPITYDDWSSIAENMSNIQCR